MAAFLVSGAQAAFAVTAPAEHGASLGATGAQDAAGAGTTGAQQATSCPEPRLTGLPKRPKFTNATIHFKLLNMTKGASYDVKAGRSEVLGGGAEEAMVKNSFQLPDQGAKSRMIRIDVVIWSEACENSPWKLTKKIRYKAVGHPATPTPPANQPAASAPGKSATPTPTPAPTPAPKPVKPPKPFNPVSTLPKLPPKGPSLKLRTWMTPLDGGSRLTQPPVGPKLSRIEQKSEKAKSSAALVGLAVLFVVVGGIGAVSLTLLRRREDFKLEEAFGVLPQHLEEGSPDMPHTPQPEDEPATAPLGAHMESSASAPAAVSELPAAPNGAETLSPAEHRAQVEAELQRLLTEAGIDTQLDGILAEAREEAEKQGIAIDPDLMLRALTDELDSSQTLSEANRSGLRAMFQEIIAEETDQVPQQVP